MNRLYQTTAVPPGHDYRLTRPGASWDLAAVFKERAIPTTGEIVRDFVWTRRA